MATELTYRSVRTIVTSVDYYTERVRSLVHERLNHGVNYLDKISESDLRIIQTDLSEVIELLKHLKHE